MSGGAIGKFRKLPVVVEAAQYPGPTVANLALWEKFEDWLVAKLERGASGPARYVGEKLIIPTLEGDMTANPGDWIICGVAGELYPCERSIFAQTYVRVQD